MATFTPTKLERFKGANQCYYTHNGFLVTDILGGPLPAENIKKTFTARDDDVYVVSFPKTGTHWIQEVVYLLGTDFDYESAMNEQLFFRFPYVDHSPGNTDMLDFSKISSPRFLKFHYPYSLLPSSIIEKKCKIIVPFRNPKDTIVSYYYFSKANTMLDYEGDLEAYLDDFVNDKVIYAPYWKHILEFWEKRHEENILIVTYEDMKKDLATVVRKVADFLGKSPSQEEIDKLVEHCSFESMKENPSIRPPIDNLIVRHKISPMFRKGIIGDWKNYFTEEMNEKVNKYIEKHFSGTDLKFVYE